MITTSYGSWTRVDSGSARMVDSVRVALGEDAAHYDVDDIADDWRRAINDGLPLGVSLCGDDFYGPYADADRVFDGYPVGEDGALDLKAIVDAVDLWAIVDHHD